MDQSPKAQALLNKHITLNLNWVIQYILHTNEFNFDFSNEEWFESLFLQHREVENADREEEEEVEYETREPYEFWAVSNYFGEFLQKKDELVTDVWGFYLWGRETTGQSILLDHVFQEFVKEHYAR